MNYIKTFEKLVEPYPAKCWKINSNHSIDKFLTGLDKIGLKDKFYVNWGVDDINDFSNLNLRKLKGESVYLLEVRSPYMLPPDNDYFFYNSIEDVESDLVDNFHYKQTGSIGFMHLIDCEEVDVTDEEVELFKDVNKYNL